MWKERGELSYWTGSTESLINIHQWESNNISLYRSDLNWPAVTWLLPSLLGGLWCLLTVYGDRNVSQGDGNVSQGDGMCREWGICVIWWRKCVRWWRKCVPWWQEQPRHCVKEGAERLHWSLSWPLLSDHQPGGTGGGIKGGEEVLRYSSALCPDYSPSKTIISPRLLAVL